MYGSVEENGEGLRGKESSGIKGNEGKGGMEWVNGEWSEMEGQRRRITKERE